MNELAEVARVVIGRMIGYDLVMFRVINGQSGNWVLDRLAWFAEDDDFSKGGALMAAYWWFWFAPDPREERRRTIVSTLIGTMFSLVICRTLALNLPFRERPLYAAEIGYHPPSLPGVHDLNMENWSSFPSDNAAVYFALAYGLWRLSPPVGIVAMCFASIWVDLVRVYLGMHYPFDIIAGSAIGLISVYVTCRINSDTITVPVLGFERNFPQAFYAAMFVITFEMTALFGDIRRFMHGSLLVLHAFRFDSVGLLGALAVGVGMTVLFCLAILLLIRLLRRRKS